MCSSDLSGAPVSPEIIPVMRRLDLLEAKIDWIARQLLVETAPGYSPTGTEQPTSPENALAHEAPPSPQPPSDSRFQPPGARVAASQWTPPGRDGAGTTPGNGPAPNRNSAFFFDFAYVFYKVADAENGDRRGGNVELKAEQSDNPCGNRCADVRAEYNAYGLLQRY